MLKSFIRIYTMNSSQGDVEQRDIKNDVCLHLHYVTCSMAVLRVNTFRLICMLWHKFKAQCGAVLQETTGVQHYLCDCGYNRAPECPPLWLCVALSFIIQM